MLPPGRIIRPQIRMGKGMDKMRNWIIILVFSGSVSGFCETAPSEIRRTDRSASLSFQSVPAIEKGLQTLSSGFNPFFDVDLLRSSDWKRKIYKGESSYPPLPYHPLRRVQRDLAIPNDVRRIESAIENAAVFLAKLEQSGETTVHDELARMTLPVAMKRTVEDVALFFRLRGSSGDLLLFEKIKTRHMDIANQASPE